jgi:hypothetical protein
MPDLWLVSPEWRILLLVDHDDESRIRVEAPDLDYLRDFVGAARLEQLEVKPPNRTQPNYRVSVPREIGETSVMAYIDTIRANPMQWFDLEGLLRRRDQNFVDPTELDQ